MRPFRGWTKRAGHRQWRVLCGVLLVAGALLPAAQAQRPQAVTPQLLQVPTGTAAPATTAARPHYDVVALRVEFQPDTSRFTTGEGTFAGALYDDGLAAKVDPLPHDAAYFQAHLDFLAHYVDRVSDGATQVTTHVIPEVVRVSQPMGAYSPTGFAADSDEELRKLAALVEEAWTLADQQTTFDASRVVAGETAFVLFHAGVGRDIELIGTTLDKTPQDLPSLFFDGAALARLGVDGLTYKGLPLDHTIILPRTESRQGFDFINDEAFLIELSINGLLAASFFNYLGIPDLFDTDDGTSAIGPFGLMDPLGIFAFNGLFPPEPMAWTKQQLGWVRGGDLKIFNEPPGQPISLQASSVANANEVAIITVSGEATRIGEAFWVENRHRDPEEDGLILQVWQDGQVREQRVENGDSLFNTFTQEGFLGGVVVGVDNYDWALPGGVDEVDNPLNGGLLIWHIDEGRIDNGLRDNTVNADPVRRGIDLEEADSGQDLGNPSDNPLGPQLDLGSPFDFYYEGNPVQVITQAGNRVSLYQNRFGPDTYPSSETNAGGPSFVVLDNFSAMAPVMTFEYRAREAVRGISVSNDQGAERYTSNPGSFLIARGETEVEGLILSSVRRTVWTQTNTGVIFERFGIHEDSHPVQTPDGRYLQLVQENNTPDLILTDEPSGTLRTALASGTLSLGNILIGGAPGDYYTVLFEGAESVLAKITEDGTVAAYEIVLRGAINHLAWAGDDLGIVQDNSVRLLNGDTRWIYTSTDGISNVLGQPTFGRDRNGRIGAVSIARERRMLWLLPSGATRTVELAELIPDTPIPLNSGFFGDQAPVLVDLDGDALLDALFTYGNQLVAVTQGGAIVENFPLELPAGSVAQPLVARLTSSGGWSILVAPLGGDVYAYDMGAGGALIDGFPLASGTGTFTTPVLANDKLYVAPYLSPIQGWRLENMSEIWWGQQYGNAQNQSYVELVPDDEPAPGASLIDATETYNWPNPVRDGRTRLRVKTEKPSTVRITIIDGSGRKVDEVEMANVPGGVPTEVLWTANVQSGIYYARVRARATDGSEDTHLYKIAVLR